MGFLKDLFMSEEQWQKEANEKFASTDLSKYKKIETKITGSTDEKRQKVIAKLKIGDVLRANQYSSRGIQNVGFSTAWGEHVGKLLQKVADDLTIKGNWSVGPDGSTGYDVEKWFYVLSGFAVVKEITGKNRKTVFIDYYYQKQWILSLKQKGGCS